MTKPKRKLTDDEIEKKIEGAKDYGMTDEDLKSVLLIAASVSFGMLLIYVLCVAYHPPDDAIILTPDMLEEECVASKNQRHLFQEVACDGRIVWSAHSAQARNGAYAFSSVPVGICQLDKKEEYYEYVRNISLCLSYKPTGRIKPKALEDLE